MSSTSTNRSLTEPSLNGASKMLAFQPWNDPHFDRWGSEPRSSYVERFWLPVLGPSSIVLARNIMAAFDSNNGGYRINSAVQAGSVGLAPGQLRRVIERLVGFGLAKYCDPNTVALRTAWPLIGSSAIRQLPKAISQLHSDWILLTDTLDPDSVQQREFWRLTVAEHGKGASPVDLDAALRRLGCAQQLRIELVDWINRTPTYGRKRKA
jgi:hypothetical protein